MSLSNQRPSRILLSMFCAMILVVGSVIWLFVFMGIPFAVYPIFIPIIVGVVGTMFVLLACVGLLARSAASLSSNAETGQPGNTARRRVYSIPSSCPSCGQDLELSEVEWRDANTIVCPGCFSEIPVKRSAW